MTEENSERESRSFVVNNERNNSHTSSPPALVNRKRTSSSDCQSAKIKNYHERNMEHIKGLKESQKARLAVLEEEKKKLDLTRERLAKVILKRSEAMKKAKEEAKLEEMKRNQEAVIEEDPEEDKENNPKKPNISAYYRSRYASLLKSIQEQNKNKMHQKELKEQKKEKFKQKLKEDLGLDNVTSKLFVPTVSSLIASNTVTENEIVELKGNKYATVQSLPKSNRKVPQVKPPEEEDLIGKKKNAREAAEKIKKRALDHLVQLADKKENEAKKEIEAKIKVEKLKVSLRETVLGRGKTLEISKEETKEEELSDSSESPIVKKVKKTDENTIRRLAQAPKRWTAPIITDPLIFRKKYKLTEKDKVFIIMGGYPAMRKALLKRSISYIARLV